MDISVKNYNPNFCWNIKTHLVITEEALKHNRNISEIERRMLARFSQMPDLMKSELHDMSSAHFYDALHKDPSFGTVNDKINNALSRFLCHTRKAKIAAKKADRELFLREVGYAAHYLQDASTPPHTEHGNYLHKLFRLPMHIAFERGKKLGASSRLKDLKQGFEPEELPFSTLKMLFHNTALFSVQPENHVKYSNKKQWAQIQQRCFNRGINATKAYMDYILEKFPNKNKSVKFNSHRS